MKDDYATNSHYVTYTFLFKKVGRMWFLNLGVKRLMRDATWSADRADVATVTTERLDSSYTDIRLTQTSMHSHESLIIKD